MRFIRASKNPAANQSGIALFMVIAAISILSILVTEFTYVAQVNQKLAFDGLDQLKAHYLAKSGLKLSLLRLKAYKAISDYAKNMVKQAGGGKAAQGMVPKSLLDKIWSFPFFYPFPTNVPGMTPADVEKIKIFEKASGLEGKFSAIIESESGKFNLNSIVPGYVPATSPSPSPSASPSPSPTPGTTSTPTAPEIKPEALREQLKTYLAQLMQPKLESDASFADAYRDPHLLEDLVDNIAGWSDRGYERRSQTGDIPMKGAPFYHISELHMIPGMDDDLYALFAPNFTVSLTPGINVNTIKAETLKAFFPLVLEEELSDFFKNRDSEEEDGTFKAEDDFFKYIKEHFSAYQRSPRAFEDLQKQFTDNGIHFITDEVEFKITVQAQVNQSTRVIEAWVTLGSKAPTTQTNRPPGGLPNPTPTGGNPLTPPGETPDPGLKIHFMRVL